jgi:hypothetical protein
MMFCWNKIDDKDIIHILEHNKLGDSKYRSLCGKDLMDHTCNLPLGRVICGACMDSANKIKEES